MLVTVKLNKKTSLWDLHYGNNILGYALTKEAAIEAASLFVKNVQPNIPINVGDSPYTSDKTFVCTNVPHLDCETSGNEAHWKNTVTALGKRQVRDAIYYTSGTGIVTLTADDIKPLQNQEVDLLSLINLNH